MTINNRSVGTRPTGSPPPQVDLDDEQAAALFRILRELKAEHEKKHNKDDLAFLLISVCIDGGFNRGRRITRALETIGLNAQHVGMILRRGLAVHWAKDLEGFYWTLSRAADQSAT